MEQEKRFALLNQDIDASFATLEPTIKSIHDPRIKEQIGIAAPLTFQEILSGSTINTYIEHDAFAPFVASCAEALLKKTEVLLSLKEGTVTTAEALRVYSDRYVHRVNELSLSEVRMALAEASRLQTECTVQGVVVAFADIFGSITEQTTAILGRRTHLDRPAHEYAQAFTRPRIASLSEEAKRQIQQGNLSDEECLRRYYWLDQGYIGRGLTREHLQDVRSHQLLHAEFLDREVAEKELQLSVDEMRVFSVASDLIFIKSLRADSRQFAHVLINRLLDRLAREWSVPVEHLSVLAPQEIDKIFSGDQSLSSFDLRTQFVHSLCIPQGNSYEILTGFSADAYIKQHLFRETIENRSEVKGQSANLGKVTGKVRLVFGPQHNEKVCEGDILISTATSPQLLPAMKRAAAFVTDVGGITSHAAIVARELAKPCVVGTKHATEIFSDGDEVEVDAEKGIVRKI